MAAVTVDLTTRSGCADDLPAIGSLLASAYLDSAGDGASLLDPLVFEPERSLLTLEGNRVLAHVGSYGRRLAVPGTTQPCAHVALVAVAPAYRRRGLLSGLVHRQLAGLWDTHREAIAVLWASEARIYPRYGFGLASHRLDIAADVRELGQVPAPEQGPRRVHDLPVADGLPAARMVYDGVWPTRPGWSERTDAWWRHLTADPPDRRYGATALRVLLTEGRDGADGYAMWRATGRWPTTGPAGTVDVREVVAGSPDALRELWRFLLGVDLTRTVTYPFASVDDPLLYLVAEPRRLAGGLADALWVRVLNVSAALAGRRYRVPVDVVLDVRDDLLRENARRWRVSGDSSGAVCAPTSSEADLTMDIQDLGAVYFGGTPLAALAAAGRIREHRRGALAAAGAAFSWHQQPSAVEMF
jgi:predicted acetyltransferase